MVVVQPPAAQRMPQPHPTSREHNQFVGPNVNQATQQGDKRPRPKIELHSASRKAWTMPLLCYTMPPFASQVYN